MTKGKFYIEEIMILRLAILPSLEIRKYLFSMSKRLSSKLSISKLTLFMNSIITTCWMMLTRWKSLSFKKPNISAYLNRRGAKLVTALDLHTTTTILFLMMKPQLAQKNQHWKQTWLLSKQTATLKSFGFSRDKLKKLKFTHMIYKQAAKDFKIIFKWEIL